MTTTSKIEKILNRLKINTRLFSIQKLPQEGSSKKLYRLISSQDKSSYILMIMEEKNNKRGSISDWVKIQNCLKKHKIKTPNIYEHLEEESSVLMEDCSDQLLTDKINHLHKNKQKDAIEQYYKKSTLLLNNIQKVSFKNLSLNLDAKVFYDDLVLFYDNHIKPRGEKLKKIWNESLFFSEIKSLASYLDSQEKVFTHRDFHSRNLMIKNESLVLIDFQDACQGPRSYDLASLYLDPYVKTSALEKQNLLFKGIDLLEPLLTKEQRKQLQDSWKAQSVQRLYKILGSYNYLGHKLNKKKFIQYINPTLQSLATLDFYDTRWPYLTQKLSKGLLDA